MAKHQRQAEPRAKAARQPALDGVWRSVFEFTSSSRKGLFTSEHLVQLHHANRYLIGESLSGGGSFMLFRLTVEDNVATGSWQEQTDPHGYYKGATYHGAAQLVISRDGREMHGKWVGFGRDMQVNVGSWDLIYISQHAPPD